MPSYKAKSKGFYGGKLYGPSEKRQILRTEKKLSPVPSWLEPIKETRKPAAAAKKKVAKKKAAKKSSKTK